MENTAVSEIIVCTDADPAAGLFDFGIAPEILFYAYVPITITAIVMGVFVMLRDKFSHISAVLFLITLFFSLFILGELAQWILVPAGIMYFVWALSLLLHFLIVIFISYFVYLFVAKRDLPFSYKIILAIISLPVIVLLPTKLNLAAFDLSWCNALTGPLWYYLYAVETAVLALFLGWGVKLFLRYLKNREVILLPSIYLLTGAFVFLLIFAGSYLFGEITYLYEVNFVGPIGMLFFISVLSYVIVRFRAFNTKLIASQVLVMGLILLVGAEFFFVKTLGNYILISATFLGTIVGGYFLVRSVKREVEHRELAQKLATELAGANAHLERLDKMKSEFVSIASHQLRSPITSVRGYVSMILEGTYGEINPKVREVLEHVASASANMATSINDYLNISRIEAGNMKYDIDDCDLRKLVEDTIAEILPASVEKGLQLAFDPKFTGSAFVKLDVGKTKQIVQNLIDNAIKYTPEKGTVTVVMRRDEKKKEIFVDVIDSGMGISREDLVALFDKFQRAKRAGSVNANGTGLGLYIAKQMVQAMGGDIMVASAGEGKGSTFTIRFPLNGIESKWKSAAEEEA